MSSGGLLVPTLSPKILADDTTPGLPPAPAAPDDPQYARTLRRVESSVQCSQLGVLLLVHSLFTLLRVLRGMVLPLTGLTVLPNLHTLLTYLVDNVTTNSAVLPCLALGMPRTRLCLDRQVD